MKRFSAAIFLFLLASCDRTGSPVASPKAKMKINTPSTSELAQAHAEILHEMFEVVLDREPKDKAYFGSLVDSLNQGASYEGIYNGLSHSDEFNELMKDGAPAKEGTYAAFEIELKMLGKPLAEAPPKGLTLYALKQVVGDRALEAVDEMKPPQLHAWYADFAVAMAKSGVNFGIPLRNSADREFHLKWASQVSTDALKWEVLNRLDRVLNHTNLAAK